MPEVDSDGSEVSIWAGWADGHSQVSVTEPLKFVPFKSSKPPSGSVLGRSRTLSKLKLKDVEEEEDDDEEVHEPKLIHKGRVDFKTSKKKKSKVDPQNLMYDKNAAEKHLRGGKKMKDHISSVDSPSVFESRHGRRVIDNTAAVAAGVAKNVVETPLKEKEGEVEADKEGAALPKLNSKRRGSAVHFDHEEEIKEVRRVSTQRKLDKKAARKAKADSALDQSWLAHLMHIKLTLFETVCVLAIFAVFVVTLVYQMCTGKFKFQYLRHYKLRGGNKYAQ
eukprot:gene22065-28160_t